MTYSSKQIEGLTGLSYRKLDYWTRQGILDRLIEEPAHGSGTRRKWKPEAIVAITLLREVSDAFDVHPSDVGGWTVSLDILSRVLDAHLIGLTHINLGENLRLEWG